MITNTALEQFQSYQLYHSREYQESLRVVDLDIRQTDDLFQKEYLRLLQANTLLKLGKNTKAREIYFQIYRSCRLNQFRDGYLELSGKALMNAGLATKNLGQLETAVQFYRQVLADGYPGNHQDRCRTHNLLGNALITLDPEEAYQHLETALQIARNNQLPHEESLVKLNIIDYHIRRSDYDQALRLIGEELDAAQPKSYQFKLEFNLAVLEYLQKHYPSSIKHFQQLLKATSYPEDLSRVHTYLALAQYRAGNRREALIHIHDARQLVEPLETDKSFVDETWKLIQSNARVGRVNQVSLANTLFHRHGMIGVSAQHHQLMTEIDALADTRQSILITGETGTGKEMVTRAIVQAGSRSELPFIPVNCPAIPESLFESILFGHRKGSFTGANEDRVGLIEAAGEGTLFFDEIGDLPLFIQPKLLRFLENGEYLVMGSRKVRRSRARIIAATNRDLEELVRNGKFREDLLQRIGVFRMNIPPLREHPEDIFFLSTGFLDALNREHDTETTLSEETILHLERYHYPGNVRELKNMILRGYQTRHQVIEPSDLGLSNWRDHTPRSQPEAVPVAPETPVDLEKVVADFERDFIIRYLEKNRGNREQSALDLGISTRSLKYKLQKLGIRSQSYKI